MLTVIVVAMAGLLALHIAEPCNKIWPDAANCLAERVRGEADDSTAETSAPEPEQATEAESEPTSPPELDPVPEGEASGDDDVVECGASSCSQGAALVYPIEDGDACVSGGVLGDWRESGVAMNYSCDVPDGPLPEAPFAEPISPMGQKGPVVCVGDECQNRQGAVSAPAFGESCEVDIDGDVPGTWTTVEAIAPIDGDVPGTIWRCLED